MLSAKTLAQLPSGAPAHLRYLLSEFEAAVAQEGWGDAAWEFAVIVDFLRAYYAAAAINVWNSSGPLPPDARTALAAPPAENRWPDLLEPALEHLGSSSELTSALRTAVGKGLPEPPEGSRESLNWALPGLRAALERAAEFFARWAETVEPGIEEGQLKVTLTGPSERLDLAPFLEVRDCPDTGTLGQPFLLAGGLPGGGLAYRNLRQHNLVYRPSQPSPWGSPAGRADASAPAGGGVPFAQDPHRVAPEMVLAPLRRWLFGGSGGYLLVEAPEGLGKTYLARFLHADQRATARVSTFYFPLQKEEAVDPALFTLRLDEVLRTDPRHHLPHPAVARELLRRQPNLSQLLSDYLLMLARFGAKPAVLLLDGVEEGHQGLVELLTDLLPEGVFVVLFYDPSRVGARLGARLDELGVRGQKLRLDSDGEQTRDLLVRLAHALGAEAAAASPLALRLRQLAGELAAGDPVEAYLDVLRRRHGEAFFSRAHLKALLLLGAARGPLPAGHLADRLGSWERLAKVAVELGPLMVRDGDWIELGHPLVGDYLAHCHPDRLQGMARRLVSWGTGQLMAGAEQAGLAALRLFGWLRQAGDRALERRCLTDPLLRQKLLEQLQDDGAAVLWPRLEAARLWIEGLAPAAEREQALSAVLAELLLVRSRLCHTAGDDDGARGEVDRAVERLGAILRWGEATSSVTVDLAGAYFHRAVLQVDRGGHHQAAEDARRTIDLLERSGHAAPELEAEAHRIIAITALREGDEQLALTELAQADRLHLNLCTRRWLSDLKSRMGSSEEGVELLTTALEDSSDRGYEQAMALATRARILEELERISEAMTDMEAAGTIVGELVDVQHRLDLRAARAEIDHEHGLLLWGLGRAAEADTAVSRAVDTLATLVGEGELRHQPGWAESLGDRGLIRSALGKLEGLDDFARAVSLYSRLVEKERRLTLRAELARTSNNRGRMLASLGRAEDSVPEFDRAVEHFGTLALRQGHNQHLPELGLAHFNRAGALGDLGRHRQALADYDRAVEHMRAARTAGEECLQELAEALCNRGFCKLELAQAEDAAGDYAEAADLLEDPQRQAVARNNRAEALAVQGRLELALADYGRAVELSDEVGYRLNRVLALGSLARFEEARAELEIALEQASGEELGLAWALAAWCSESLRDLERSASECRRAARLLGNESDLSPRGRLELGRALRRSGRVRGRLGDHAQALEDLERARKQFQDSEELAWVETVRAEVLLSGGEFEQAEQAAERAMQLSELQERLARAHFLKGRSLQERKLSSHPAFQQAVELYTLLVEDQGRHELCPELSQAYRRRAQVADTDELCIADYGWAVDIMQELVERESRHELRGDLACLHAERAALLRRLGRGHEEDGDLKRAVMLYHAAVEQGEGELAEELATNATRLAEVRRRAGDLTAARNLCQRALRALAAHPREVPEALGAALREAATVSEALRELPRALEYHDQAVEVLDELVRLHGRTARARDLLAQRTLRADVQIRLGHYQEALEDLELAIAGLRKSGDHQALAGALIQRGSVLGRLERLEEGLNSYSEALGLASELEDDFMLRADGLSKRGLTFNHHHRYREAVESFTQAVRELRSEPMSLQLGLVLLHRGESYWGLEDAEQAYQDSDRAVELMSHLARSSQALGLHSSLAQAFANRGRAQTARGRSAEALSDFREAVDRFTRLTEEFDYASFRQRLAAAYLSRAEAALAARDPVEAMSAIRNSVVIYRAMAASDDSHREALARALVFRADLLKRSRKADQAVEDYELAASILTALVQVEGRQDLSDLLQHCRQA